MFRQRGGRPDEGQARCSDRASADCRPGRRAARHNGAFSPAPHCRAAHSVRPHRAARQDSGVRGRGTHRGGPGRTGQASWPTEERSLMAGSRRYFGNVRRRESGRYQARYRAPDGKLRSAPHTFSRKAEAVRWPTLKEAEIRRGDWIDTEHAGVLFGNYAEQWLNDRVLKVRTADLYQSLLRNHLLPAFGPVRLSDIDEAAVRRWRKERLNTGV